MHGITVSLLCSGELTVQCSWLMAHGSWFMLHGSGMCPHLTCDIKKNICVRQHGNSMTTCFAGILVPQRDNETCWFTTILMVLMSGMLRELLLKIHKPISLEEIRTLKDSAKITGIQLFQGMLDLKQTGGVTDEPYLEFFDIIDSNFMLNTLANEDSKLKSPTDGGDPRYMLKMFEYLGLQYAHVFAVYQAPGSYAYPTADFQDHGNEVQGTMISHTTNIAQGSPDILFVSLLNDDPSKEKYEVGASFDLAEEIKYNGVTYVCDAVIMSNTNRKKVFRDATGKVTSITGINGHAIAGVTCNGKKYVYDGDLKTMTHADRKPCALYDINWLENDDFSITVRDCIRLPEINTDMRRVFNRCKDQNAYHIYIRKPVVTRIIPTIPVKVKRNNSLKKDVSYPCRSVNSKPTLQTVNTVSAQAPIVDVKKGPMVTTTLQQLKASITNLVPSFEVTSNGFSSIGYAFEFEPLNEADWKVQPITGDKLYMQAVIQTLILSINQFQEDSNNQKGEPLQAAEVCQMAMHMVAGLISEPTKAETDKLKKNEVLLIFTGVATILLDSMARSYKKNLSITAAGDAVTITLDGASGVISTAGIDNMVDSIVCIANMTTAIFITATTPTATSLTNVGALIKHYLEKRKGT